MILEIKIISQQLRHASNTLDSMANISESFFENNNVTHMNIKQVLFFSLFYKFTDNTVALGNMGTSQRSTQMVNNSQVVFLQLLRTLATTR